MNTWFISSILLERIDGSETHFYLEETNVVSIRFIEEVGVAHDQQLSTTVSYMLFFLLKIIVEVSVCQAVGRSVLYNFLKGRDV